MIRVSKNLQKAQKRLSKPFAKKNIPATPDSAAADSLEEDELTSSAPIDEHKEVIPESVSDTVEVQRDETAVTEVDTKAQEESTAEESKPSGVGMIIYHTKSKKESHKQIQHVCMFVISFVSMIAHSLDYKFHKKFHYFGA